MYLSWRNSCRGRILHLQRMVRGEWYQSRPDQKTESRGKLTVATGSQSGQTCACTYKKVMTHDALSS